MSLNFLRNKKLPKFFNPVEQATKITATQIEVDEIISVINNSQQFQQQSSSGQTAPMPNTSYVDSAIIDAKMDILGGAGGAYDTLKEIQTMMEADDTVMAGVLNTLANKINTTSVVEQYYNKIQSDEKFGTLTQIDNLQGQIDTNTNNITTNTNNISTNITNISTNATNITNLTNSLNTLNSRTSNIDNTSDLNKPINTATSTALSLKSDKEKSLYQNTWYVNCGVNLLSSILSSIGSSSGQSILISAGQVNEPSPITITQTNMTICGIDSAFASPSTLINNNVTLSGSLMTRCRISNVGFMENFTIDGTQGRHTFKGVVFQKNLTLLGSTTNFMNFYYCSFMGQINIPITFAGYIIFYFCDFSGATLNFLNSLPQQIYINSCVNLPSLTGLNASLNGYNVTISQASGIATTTLNVSGATQFPSGSISQTSITNLTSDLGSKLATTTAQSTYATLSSLNTTNTNVTNLTTRVGTAETDITNLKAKTNVMSYDATNNILNLNSSLLVTRNEYNFGLVQLGNEISDGIHLFGQLVCANTGINLTPTNLSLIFGLTGNCQTQLNSKLAITTYNTKMDSIDSSISTLTDDISDLQTSKADITYVDSTVSTAVANLVGSSPSSLDTIQELSTALQNTPEIISNLTTLIGNKINTSDANSTFATISSLNTTNSNVSTNTSDITSLKSKTNAISYDSNSDTLSISSKVSIAKDLSDIGSVYLGDNVGNDIIYLRGNLGVNNTQVNPIQLSYLNSLSSNVQTQLNARAWDNAVVKLSGDQTIAGIKTFSSAPVLPNNSITNAMINNTAISSGFVDASSSIQTQLNTLSSGKQNNLTFDTTPTSSSNNPITSGGVFTSFQDYYNKSTSDGKFATIINLNSVNSQFSSYLTNSNALSTFLTISNASSTYQTISNMSSYLTSTTASSTYQAISAMSSYFGLSSNNTASGANTFSGRNTFSNMNTFNRVCESVNQAGSGTNLTLDYSTLNAGIIFYAPSANYTLSVSNIPITNTNCIYTLTLRYSTRFYANAISINGTTYTMTAIGGLANISISSSATFVYQQIQIIFNNINVPSVTTSVLSVF